jgi:hypothetical protein
MVRDEHQPLELACRHPDKPGIVFRVSGGLTTTRWFDAGETGREPHRFEMGRRVTIDFETEPTSEMANAAGVRGLHRAVERYYREAAGRDPTMFGRAKSLPPPGRRGLADGYYAVWAKKYIDAVDELGRGAVKHLIETNPGLQKSNLHRTLERAEALGLVTFERSPGRPNRGQLTDAGTALVVLAGEVVPEGVGGGGWC